MTNTIDSLTDKLAELQVQGITPLFLAMSRADYKALEEAGDKYGAVIHIDPDNHLQFCGVPFYLTDIDESMWVTKHNGSEFATRLLKESGARPVYLEYDWWLLQSGNSYSLYIRGEKEWTERGFTNANIRIAMELNSRKNYHANSQ